MCNLVLSPKWIHFSLIESIIQYLCSVGIHESPFKTLCKHNASYVCFLHSTCFRKFNKSSGVPPSFSHCFVHHSLVFFCSFYVNVAIRGPNTCALAEWEPAAAGKSCHWGTITQLESFRALTSVRPWDVWRDIKQVPVKSCECEDFLTSGFSSFVMKQMRDIMRQTWLHRWFASFVSIQPSSSAFVTCIFTEIWNHSSLLFFPTFNISWLCL